MTVKPEYEALLEALKPWKCCGAPGLCGATCQDDEMSATLAKGYELVRQVVDEEVVSTQYGFGREGLNG